MAVVVHYFFVLLQIMADRNLEDNDIEPAPKLIEVVFQNCKGQVDQWVEPYLRITVDRLRRTEKSYLKCLLMQVVRSQELAIMLPFECLFRIILPQPFLTALSLGFWLFF